MKGKHLRAHAECTDPLHACCSSQVKPQQSRYQSWLSGALMDTTPPTGTSPNTATWAPGRWPSSTDTPRDGTPLREGSISSGLPPGAVPMRPAVVQPTTGVPCMCMRWPVGEAFCDFQSLSNQWYTGKGGDMEHPDACSTAVSPKPSPACTKVSCYKNITLHWGSLCSMRSTRPCTCMSQTDMTSGP